MIHKSMIILALLLLSQLVLPISKNAVANPSATLTGVVTEQGQDFDDDGIYEFLYIDVQVNIQKAGYYGVALTGLISSNSSYIDIRPERELSPLEPGLQMITLYVYGPWIHTYGQNVLKIASLTLLDKNANPIGELKDVKLSREYKYTEFDSPGATFTSQISDKGVDTDGDGTFDYLEIDVGVNVTIAPTSQGYSVSVLGNGSEAFGFGASTAAWELGSKIVPVQLDGRVIRAAGIEVASLPILTLKDDTGNAIGARYDVPLSRKYLYTEFDQPGASVTGKIRDKGVDMNGDGKYDFLKIDAEVEVREAGQYYFSAILTQEVGGSNYTTLDVGKRIVSLLIDGPAINAFKLNPEKVKLQASIDRIGQQEVSNIPLSHTYMYTDFDLPQVQPGSWSKYTVNATWHSTDHSAAEPKQVKDQKQVDWLKINIENVTNVITLSQVTHYKNGTENTVRPQPGIPKYTFMTYIIPSGLKAGDSIPASPVPFSPVALVEGIYSGMSRELVNSKFSMSFFGINATMTMFWDRSTGILCEMNTTTLTRTNGGVTTQSTITRLVETNLWKSGTKITCSAFKSEVIAGDTTTILGVIDPVIKGATVSLTFTKPDGSKHNSTLTTDQNGGYSNSYQFDQPGKWTVKASWAGNENYSGASNSALVTVNPKPQSGVPGYPFEAVIIGVVVSLLLGGKLMRRRGEERAKFLF
jgi:hypothetical protein